MINNYFIDTSALFKRYFPERGTEQIDDIFNEANSTFYISDITIIEIVSNLKRKNEITRELNNEIYSKIKKEFFNDIAHENIKTVGIFSENIIKAITLIDKKYVTPLDSIQLATALQLNSELQNIVFVCSDKKLSDLAQEYGIKTIII